MPNRINAALAEQRRDYARATDGRDCLADLIEKVLWELDRAIEAWRSAKGVRVRRDGETIGIMQATAGVGA